MTLKEKERLRKNNPFSRDQERLARAAEESAKASPQEKKADWDAKHRARTKK